MRKLNYIAAFHYGERMNSVYTNKLKNNKFYIFEEHLVAITAYHSGIDLVTFAFNLDNLEDELMIKNKINSYNIPFEYEVVCRPNEGASYGAWAHVITKNIEDFEYYFVTEDDYIPCSHNFHQPFIDRCKDDYFYICMFGEKIPPPGMIYHASIPEGVINGNACREVLAKQNNLFYVIKEKTYDSFYKTQELYCQYFVNEGYKVGDITDAYCSPFMNSPTLSIKIFGEITNPVIFKPIPLS